MDEQLQVRIRRKFVRRKEWPKTSVGFVIPGITLAVDPTCLKFSSAGTWGWFQHGIKQTLEFDLRGPERGEVVSRWFLGIVSSHSSRIQDVVSEAPLLGPRSTVVTDWGKVEICRFERVLDDEVILYLTLATEGFDPRAMLLVMSNQPTPLYLPWQYLNRGLILRQLDRELPRR